MGCQLVEAYVRLEHAPTARVGHGDVSSEGTVRVLLELGVVDAAMDAVLSSSLPAQLKRRALSMLTYLQLRGTSLAPALCGSDVLAGVGDALVGDGVEVRSVCVAATCMHCVSHSLLSLCGLSLEPEPVPQASAPVASVVLPVAVASAHEACASEPPMAFVGAKSKQQGSRVAVKCSPVSESRAAELVSRVRRGCISLQGGAYVPAHRRRCDRVLLGCNAWLQSSAWWLVPPPHMTTTPPRLWRRCRVSSSCNSHGSRLSWACWATAGTCAVPGAAAATWLRPSQACMHGFLASFVR